MSCFELTISDFNRHTTLDDVDVGANVDDDDVDVSAHVDDDDVDVE